MKKMRKRISILTALLILMFSVLSVDAASGNNGSRTSRSTNGVAAGQVIKNEIREELKNQKEEYKAENRTQEENRTPLGQEVSETVKEQLRERIRELICEHLEENGVENTGTPDWKQIDQQSLEDPELDEGLLEEIVSEETGEEPETEYDYIEFLGNVTQEEYDTFESYLILVDTNVLQDFVDEGWTIILTTADLDDLLFGGTTEGVEGAIVYDQETIYIAADDYSYCVIHEMGHYVDYYYGFASTSSEFAQIYQEEGDDLTAYSMTSATEFFAEVYMYIILNEDDTVESCPLASEYVMNLVSTLE